MDERISVLCHCFVSFYSALVVIFYGCRCSACLGTTCISLPRDKKKKDTGSPRIGAIGGCELRGCWELYSGSLEEQCLMST